MRPARLGRLAQRHFPIRQVASLRSERRLVIAGRHGGLHGGYARHIKHTQQNPGDLHPSALPRRAVPRPVCRDVRADEAEIILHLGRDHRPDDDVLLHLCGHRVPSRRLPDLPVVPADRRGRQGLDDDERAARRDHSMEAAHRHPRSARLHHVHVRLHHLPRLR